MSLNIVISHYKRLFWVFGLSVFRCKGVEWKIFLQSDNFFVRIHGREKIFITENNGIENKQKWKITDYLWVIFVSRFQCKEENRFFKNQLVVRKKKASYWDFGWTNDPRSVLAKLVQKLRRKTYGSTFCFWIFWLSGFWPREGKEWFFFLTKLRKFETLDWDLCGTNRVCCYGKMIVWVSSLILCTAHSGVFAPSCFWPKEHNQLCIIRRLIQNMLLRETLMSEKTHKPMWKYESNKQSELFLRVLMPDSGWSRVFSWKENYFFLEYHFRSMKLQDHTLREQFRSTTMEKQEFAYQDKSLQKAFSELKVRQFSDARELIQKISIM